MISQAGSANKILVSCRSANRKLVGISAFRLMVRSNIIEVHDSLGFTPFILDFGDQKRMPGYNNLTLVTARTDLPYDH